MQYSGKIKNKFYVHKRQHGWFVIEYIVNCEKMVLKKMFQFACICAVLHFEGSSEFRQKFTLHAWKIKYNIFLWWKFNHLWQPCRLRSSNIIILSLITCGKRYFLQTSSSNFARLRFFRYWNYSTWKDVCTFGEQFFFFMMSI